MAPLPDGIITFAFTDVEGSTRLWEDAPDSMMLALATLDGLVEEATDATGGTVVKPRGEGDSHFLVFRTAPAAVSGIARLQKAVASTNWQTSRPLKVRAALHTGSAEVSAGDYYGSAVNRTARLRAIAHGGQTVISRSTWELVADSALDGATRLSMLHRLRRPQLPASCSRHRRLRVGRDPKCLRSGDEHDQSCPCGAFVPVWKGMVPGQTADEYCCLVE